MNYLSQKEEQEVMAAQENDETISFNVGFYPKKFGLGLSFEKLSFVGRNKYELCLQLTWFQFCLYFIKKRSYGY